MKRLLLILAILALFPVSSMAKDYGALTPGSAAAKFSPPNSATLPATCTVGQIYIDNDATTKQQFYVCESTDTWVLQTPNQSVDSGASPTFDAANITGTVTGAVETTHIDVRKNTAGSIPAGSAVYFVEYNASGWYDVEAADCDNASAMPAVCITEVATTNTATVSCTTSGRITGVDTSSFSADGVALYVSDVGDGSLTETRPANTDDLVQKVGIVARDNVAGVIFVQGAGRSNDVPNLPEDQIWQGSSTNVATAGHANKSKYKTTAAATYTIGATSAAECYGGYITVTGASVIDACDNLAIGMNFTVSVQGDIAVSLDVQPDDRMRLDGTALDVADRADNTSTSGDTITCFYESADGWDCWSSSTAGTKWSDGGTVGD